MGTLGAGTIRTVSLADGPLARTAFSWLLPSIIGALFAITLVLMAGFFVVDLWRAHRSRSEAAGTKCMGVATPQPAVKLAD
jgi:hypothetical protein